MIKTLSPYFFEVPLTDPITGLVCSKFKVDLYVWVGERDATPSQPAYTSTLINAEQSSGVKLVQVGSMLNDFIEWDSNSSGITTLSYSNSQVWSLINITYDELTNASISIFNLGLKGYGYFMDGNNPQPPSNKWLINGDDFSVQRNGMFCLSLLMQEAIPAPPPEDEFKITSIEEDGVTINFVNDLDSNLVFVQVSTDGGVTWNGLTTSIFTTYLVLDDPLPSPCKVRLSTFDYSLNIQVYTEIYDYS